MVINSGAIVYSYSSRQKTEYVSERGRGRERERENVYE